MGIYDREYYQERPPGIHFGGNRMMVTNLVILNVIIYIIQLFFRSDNPTDFSLTRTLSLHSNLLSEPWNIWQLVTYGFVHSDKHFFHILGNMFCLWFFGRDVEAIYGKKTFLWFYLTLDHE